MKNSKTIADGRRVRAAHKPSRHLRARGVKLRTRYKLSPNQVIAVILDRVRDSLGDAAAAGAVLGAAGGCFYIRLGPQNITRVRDRFWRKTLRVGVNLRRYSLGLAFRAMSGEKLVDL
jgi:hypothetical protein